MIFNLLNFLLVSFAYCGSGSEVRQVVNGVKDVAPAIMEGATTSRAAQAVSHDAIQAAGAIPAGGATQATGTIQAAGAIQPAAVQAEAEQLSWWGRVEKYMKDAEQEQIELGLYDPKHKPRAPAGRR